LGRDQIKRRSKPLVLPEQDVADRSTETNRMGGIIGGKMGLTTGGEKD